MGTFIAIFSIIVIVWVVLYVAIEVSEDLGVSGEGFISMSYVVYAAIPAILIFIAAKIWLSRGASPPTGY
jgi:hypothetical protein